VTLDALSVRGPFRGTTGYDHHVREFVRELVRQGVAVHLEGLPEWTSSRHPATDEDTFFAGLSRPVPARVSLQFCMPHHVVPQPGLVTVNYTMFEATAIPPDWAEQ